MQDAIKTYRSHIGSGQICMMHIHPISDMMHNHAFFELVYVIRGSATHHLGEDVARISAGDYFIIDTGTTHCYRDIQDFEIVNCLFLPEYVDRALADCPTLSMLLSNQVMRFGVPVDIRAADRIYRDDGTVKHLIGRMEQEYAGQHTGYMELLRCYLTQILVFAVRACEETERTRDSHPATEEMASYLRAHFDRSLSLETFSRMLGYTPQYLSALFRKDTGMSLQEYQQHLRIAQATKLLQDPGLSLADVARQVGYTDPKHFSRVFRRHKGISPRAFRAEGNDFI